MNIGYKSNVHLESNGRLTYTTDSVINLRKHHSNSHSGNKKSYDVYTDATNGDDGFGFIYNVNLSVNGHLSYESASVTNLRQHHITTKPTSVAQAYNVYKSNVSGDNKVGIVSAVNLDLYGHLTYSIISIDNLRTHHSQQEITAEIAYNIDEHDKTGIDEATWIHSVELTTYGDLKYQKRTIKNLKSHHGGSHGTHGVNKAYAFGEAFTFIDHVELSANGTLSGQSKTVTLPKITQSPSSKTTPLQFVRTVNLSGGTSTEAKIAYVYDDIWGLI